MSKAIGLLFVAIVLAVALQLLPGSFAADLKSTDVSGDALFQTSTLSALNAGVFDGTLTFKELKTHGDTGVGTFNHLDGEMVEVDGNIYQVKSDGVAYPVNDSMKTPFAEVTFFKPEQTVQMNGTMNLTSIEKNLQDKVLTKNAFYAVRIDGTFDYIKTRSVPAQKEPYPVLTEAVKGQKIFEFHNQTGTVVGFWCPDYMKTLNLPGYHLHFINSARSAGGHLLDLRANNISIKLDRLTEFEMDLPTSGDFYNTSLAGDVQSDLKKVEANTK